MDHLTRLILVVDDDASTRRLLEVMLERAGYEIILVDNAEDAIEAAINYQPHLVIMDDVLPGMLGDAARRILQADPRTTHIPVLMHTGRPERMITRMQHEAPDEVINVIPKPTRPAVFLEAVRNCLVQFHTA